MGEQASLKEMGESQFAPFLDEIIDTDELPLVHDRALQSDSDKWAQSNAAMSGSKHILQEMAIVRSHIGFDEQAFRDKCQRIQAELCQEFKGTLKSANIAFSNNIAGIVDEIYDVLESVISEYSKAMYQMQVDALKEFEGSLSDIRRTTVRTATMEQSLQHFINNMQQAYRSAFDD